MARTFQEIYGDSIKSVKALREEVKALQGALIGVTEDSEQYKETTEKLWVAQDELTKVTAKSKKEMVAAEDSIVGMERKYKELYNTYKTMSESMRNSDIGKSTAESLKTLSEELNKTKMDVGNFKDNIGHYSEGVIDAFGKMGLSLGAFQAPFQTLISIVGQGKDSMENNLKSLGSSIQGISSQLAAMGGPAAVAKAGLMGVGQAMKALIANPVGAVIMAIVVAFKALQAIANRVKEAINANEDSQMKLKEAMSAFQPVVDGVSNAFDKLGQIVVKVIGFIGDAFRKIREMGAAVTDFLGITSGANKRIKEQNELYKNLAVTQNKLTKQKREYQQLDAKDKSEVERLREEASETTNLEERKRLLTEAKAKQAEIDNRNIEIAKEEARIIQTQASLTANDAEMNDRLAAAMAKVSEAEAAAAANARMFNRQMKSGAGGASSYGAAVKSARQEADELYKQLVEDSKTEVQKLDEKYYKEKKLLERYHKDTTLLTQQYEENRQKILNESSQRMRETLLRNMQYEQAAISRYGETLTGVAAASFNKEQVEKNIEDLRLIREKAQELKDEWKESYLIEPLEVVADARSKGIYETVEKDLDTIFKDFFKEGTDFDALEYPLKEVKKLFDKAGLITGDDIIDIESIDLNIKILQNRLKGLQDNIINERMSYKANESDLNYVKGLLNVINDENLIDEQTASRVAELGRINLEERKAALEEELQNFKGSKELELQLTKEYYDVVAQLRENDTNLEKLSVERRTQMYDDMVKNLGSIGQSFGSLVNSQKTLIDAQEKDGKISEETAKKKKKNLEALARIQRDLAVLSIAGDTASAVMKIWNGYAAERVVNAETAAAAMPASAGVLAALNAKSLISAIANTAGIAANAAAQIAAAQGGYVSTVNNLRGDSGSGSASVSAPTEIESNPYTYTRTVQTTEEEDLINRPIYVTVTDIEEGLNRVEVTEKESKF